MLIDSSDLEFNKQIDTVRASPTVKVITRSERIDCGRSGVLIAVSIW
jgi:hypothetical protein